MPSSLIVNLNPVIRKTKSQRAGRAVRFIKEQVRRKKHLMPEQVIISTELNQKIWENGMTNIPHKVELELFEEEGKTIVYLKKGKALQEKLKQDQEMNIETKKEEKAEEKKEETKEKMEEKKKEAEEKQKKLKEKKAKEKAAEKASIKRKTK